MTDRTWKAEVQPDADGAWVGKERYFATKEEAEAYIVDLIFHWVGYQGDYRLVECDHPPTHAWTDQDKLRELP